MLEFKTSKGTFTVQLFDKQAPITVENFLKYVDDGFFDGTIFHRVIPGFMIQGGGLTADLKTEGSRAPIKNEPTNGLKNKRGTLAMARTNDINSATSQFFINLVDNDFLDHKAAAISAMPCSAASIGHGSRRRDRGREDRQQGRPPGRAGGERGHRVGHARRRREGVASDDPAWVAAAAASPDALKSASS